MSNRLVQPVNQFKMNANIIKAHCYFKMEKYEHALKAVTMALEFDHRYPGALECLVLVQIKLNKWSEARKTCSELLTKDPKNAETLAYIGLTCSKVGQHKEAVPFFVSAESQNAGVFKKGTFSRELQAAFMTS